MVLTDPRMAGLLAWLEIPDPVIARNGLQSSSTRFDGLRGNGE